MSEAKFDPVKEFVSLRDNISKAVGDSIRTAVGTTTLFPAVDVYETENEVVIITEPLIGAQPASFEVSMQEDVLTIGGETTSDLDIPEEAYLHRELRFGVFSRDVRITRPVKSTEAKASFKNNRLTITLPKREDNASQIINVTPAE